MREVNDLPADGQFVVIWEEEYGDLECDSFKWDRGVLYRFVAETGTYLEKIEDFWDGEEYIKNIKFFVK